ncbi:DUF3489 domain-containing protein [Sphingomonas sp. ID0503]|uniref:DUF3489 domain-containing protein n=1 Tax=Sphingomonas sp. ID0503 TaxID=3399691 RepID=UPI003AFA15F3
MTNTQQPKPTRRIRAAAAHATPAPAIGPLPKKPRTKAVAEAAAPPPARYKSDQVKDALRRKQGATLAELVELTGWLPHTVHGFLAGMRKKGSAIDKGERGETTCYFLRDA